MENLEIRKEFIRPGEYDDSKDAVKMDLTKAMVIFSGGAFKDYKKLEEVYFGLDITRIGNGTFEGCENLTDVWFAIIDENKIVEIADDAFYGCKKDITFHIFGSAIKNKWLNDYAKKHGYKVVGMM